MARVLSSRPRTADSVSSRPSLTIVPFQTKSIIQIDLLGNTTFVYAISASLLSLLGLIYLPPLQTIFQTETLSANDIALLVTMTSSVLVVDECFKLCYRCFLQERGKDEQEGVGEDQKKLLP